MKSSEKSRTNLRTKVALLLFDALRSTLRMLPEAVATLTASATARLIGSFRPREQEIALSQIRFAFPQGLPETNSNNKRERERQYRKLLSDVFAHYGISTVEIFNIENYFTPLPDFGSSAQTNQSDAPACPQFEKIDSNGQETVMRLVKEGRGGLALSGHIGSIELLAAYYVKCGVPLSVIGRTPNYPWLADALEEIRLGYGAQTIWREDPRSARKILRAFKSGGFVAALVDQDTRLENGFSPFFGLDAAIPIALIRLAVQHQIPVLTSFIYRAAPGHHRILTNEIHYDATEPEQAMQQIMIEFHQRLEELIVRYPEQWPWWHRRWRRRPETDYQAHPETLPSTESYLKWLAELTEKKMRDA